MIERFIQWLSGMLKWEEMPSTDNNPVVVAQVVPTAPTSPVPPVSPITYTPAGFPPMIVKWGQAVAHWEGSLSATNPGNLKYSTLTKSWGATKGKAALDGGYFCEFSTYADGFIALCNFLQLGAEHQLIISNPWPCTLQQFTIRYAGNPPLGYQEGIAAMMGVPLSTDIATFLT